MTQVSLLTPETASVEARPILAEITAAFGMTPNMFAAAANYPAALKMMWGAFGALGGGTLGAKLGEQIAVAIADIDACNYCLAAHTALGRKAGATAEEMSEAQAGRSADPKTAAVLAFVVKVVTDRAQVSDADVQALRDAGFNDEGIVEIVANIALNLYTNYLNLALDVPVDFPSVRLRKAA